MSRVYHYNNEDLNLTILQEECAEVILAISKIKRFGWDSIHPDGGVDNRVRLEQELGDVEAMIDILTMCQSVRRCRIDTGRDKKLIKLADYYEFK